MRLVAIGFLLVASASASAQRPALSVDEVRSEVAKLVASLDGLSNWSYDTIVEQRLTTTGGAEGEWESVARCVYSRRGNTSTAIQVYWRDGRIKPLPSEEDVRSGDTFLGEDVYSHLFADGESLVSYHIYDSSPDVADGLTRGIALYRGNSAQLGERPTDLPGMYSRPLLGYSPASTDNLMVALSSADEANVTVSEVQERVAGAQCVVVEARTEIGLVKMWLDPQLGWQPRRALLTKRATDRSGDRILWEVYRDRDVVRTETYEWHGFTPVHGVFMPTLFDVVVETRLRTQPSTVERQRAKATVKEGASEFEDRLWSVSTIPDGIPAAVFSEPGTAADAENYVWDGEPLRRMMGENRDAEMPTMMAGFIEESGGEEGWSEWRWWVVGAGGMVASIAVATIIWRRIRGQDALAKFDVRTPPE